MDGKQDILAIPEIVEAISNSDKKIGQLSEPVTLGERVIIYQLKALKAPEQQAISEVKPKLEQAVIAEKTDKQVAEAAKQLIENSKTGGLDKAAKAAGYPYQSFADFKGQPGDSTLLDPVAALLIARQPPRLGNDNAQEIRSPTGDVYVYVTNKVELGNSQSQENAQMTSQLTATLNEQIGRLELDEFIQSITERADITDHSNTLLAQ
ncbi:MAG: hypothetical protein CSA44_01025 [Gammaproteobacteria bacterium]|nr:MAG: hypothetical protein CSA44_01025 [Gammaproteobacteria bacterium]